MVFLIITDFTLSCRTHKPRPRCSNHGGHGGFPGFGGFGGYGGFAGFGGHSYKHTTNTNAAVGSFRNTQMNMGNGGHGNVQANSKQSFGGHCW